MYCKYNGVVRHIDRETDETYEEYNMRCFFIMKNLSKSDDFESLVRYSHVYKNMELLGCTYSENVDKKINELSADLFIT